MTDELNPVIAARKYASHAVSWDHRDSLMCSFMDGFNGTVDPNRESWLDFRVKEYDHAFAAGESFAISLNQPSEAQS